MKLQSNMKCRKRVENEEGGDDYDNNRDNNNDNDDDDTHFGQVLAINSQTESQSQSHFVESVSSKLEFPKQMCFYLFSFTAHRIDTTTLPSLSPSPLIPQYNTSNIRGKLSAQ